MKRFLPKSNLQPTAPSNSSTQQHASLRLNKQFVVCLVVFNPEWPLHRSRKNQFAPPTNQNQPANLTFKAPAGMLPTKHQLNIPPTLTNTKRENSEIIFTFALITKCHCWSCCHRRRWAGKLFWTISRAVFPDSCP